jgi:hypothetical protein
MTKLYTKINEYLNHNSDLIVEMARINGEELPYLVYVYGGNSYGSRNEHGEPHFHYMDKMNDGKFKLSIKIPSKLEWNYIKDLIILPDSSQNNWNKLKKEKKMLIEWLDIKNNDVPELTNFQFIIVQWNVLNKENKNVRQIIE